MTAKAVIHAEQRIVGLLSETAACAAVTVGVYCGLTLHSAGQSALGKG